MVLLHSQNQLSWLSYLNAASDYPISHCSEWFYVGDLLPTMLGGISPAMLGGVSPTRAIFLFWSPWAQYTLPKLTSPKYERVEMEKFLKDKYPFLLKAFLEIAINFIWFIWYINDKGQNRKCKQLRLRHKIYWLNGKYLDRKHLHSDINPHAHPHPVQEQEDPLPPGIGPPASWSSLLWAVCYLSLFIILSSSSSCITLSSYKQMPILPPPNHRCWLWWQRWCCHCCCCCRWWCQWRKHCHFAIEDVDERKDVDVAVHLTICFSTLYLPSCN